MFALLREELPSRPQPLGPAQPGAQLPGPPPLPGGAAGPPREKAHKAERESKRSKKEKKEKKVLTPNSVYVYLKAGFCYRAASQPWAKRERRCAGSVLYLHRAGGWSGAEWQRSASADIAGRYEREVSFVSPHAC